MEDRLAPATFTVTNTGDNGGVNPAANAGTGTLRQAIVDANAATTADTIAFSLGAGAQTINLAAALPQITSAGGALTITGPGASLLTVRRDAAASTSFRVFDSVTSTLTMTGFTVSGGNVGADGAGLQASGTITLDGMVFSGNTATTGFDGGAIRVNSAGFLLLRNSTLSGNTARNGAGVYFFSGGSLLMENSTISGNTSTATTATYGGALYLFGSASTTPPTALGFVASTYVVRNSTIANNSTGGSGGGIFWDSTTASGTLLIQDSTITGNSSTLTAAGSGGGGISRALGTTNVITIQNTVVSGNTNTNGPDILGLGTAAVNVNFSAVGSTTGFTASGTSGNNIAAGTNLLLGSLTAANGGPTATLLPQTGSPLINAGSNALVPAALTTDQRGSGFVRMFNTTVDIGAAEVQPFGIPAAAGSSPNVSAAGGTTQTVTVVYSDSTGTNNGILASSLGTGDITVTGPGGFTVTPTFQSVTPGGNGTPLTVTYTFTPPGGSWDGADNGSYAINVVAGQVSDVDGNFVAAAAVGSFTVALPLTLTVTNANDAGAGSLRDAITQSNAAPMADAIVFDPTFFATPRTITLATALPTITDAVTVTGPGVSLLTVSGNNAVRVLNSTAATLTLTGFTIANGSVAGDGGGLFATGTVTLDRMAVTNNKTTGANDGGGIGLGGGAFLAVRNSTISGNTAGRTGGGIYFLTGGSLVLENSTVSGNTAGASSTYDYQGGGGIYFFGTVSAAPPAGFTASTLVVRNSTIANNSTSKSGGGIELESVIGTLLVQNSTITGNTAGSTAAGYGGGGVVRDGGSATVTVQNSVISGNTNANGSDIFFYGTGGAVNVNFSAVGSTTGFTASGTSGNNVAAGTNLLLGPLANNGGPTQTIIPQAGSPLINAGSNALIPAGLTSDQRGSFAARTFGTAVDIGSIEVQPIPPIVTTTPSGAVTYTENGPAVVVDAGLTVTDPDSAQLANATVQITSGYDSVNDVLAFTPVGGITGLFSTATGTLTLSGVSSVANYQAALRSVTFIANGDNPTAGSRTLTFRATDSPTAYLSLPATQTVNVIAVNDPPAVSGITTATQAIDDTATVSPFAGVTVTDPDNPSITVTLTYTAANGTFTSLGGFTGSAGSYTFVGSPAAAQTAVRGLVFNPTANQVVVGNTVTTTFTVSASDAIAPPVTNGQTTVDAASVNDVPLFGGITTVSQPVNDNATVSPFAGVTVTDPDVGQTQTVTLTYAAANGVFTNLGGFTGSAGSYTLSGVTPAAAQAALRGLTFVPTNNQGTPGTAVTTVFTVATTDGLAVGGNNQTTVDAASVNDPPVLAGVTATSQAVNDNAAVSPFAGVTIADPDANPLTVTVSFDPANGSFSNLGGFAGSAGSYTFTGTAAAAQTAITGLLFTPVANQVAPNTTVSTTFTVAVNDGFATPVTNGQTTVAATSVDDAPVLAGVTTGTQATNDNVPVAPFGGVTIADPDVAPVTVTVRFDPANGSFSNLGGFAGSAGSYTFTGTAAAAQTALDGLLFVPTQDQVLGGQTVTTVFTLAVDDGYVAAVTDTQTTVVATSVDGTPIIGGTAAGQPVGDDATISPFAAVSVSDTDSQTFTVTISFPAANGVFTPASLAASGFTGSAGSYSRTVSAASPALATQAVQAAVRQLVFRPTSNQVAPGGTVTTAFTITVNDGNSTGTSTTSSVVATSTNDAPTLGGATAGAQPVNDNATVSPFAGVTVADADFSPTVTVTVTYAAANGTLTNLGGFAGSAGRYTFTGSPAAAQAAVRGLAFAPTANQVTPGSTVSTAFTVAVSDGLAAAVTDSQTTVAAASVNDAPALGGVTAGPQATGDTAAVSPFAAVTVADPDVNPITVTVRFDPANGSFSNLGGFAGSAGSYTFTGSVSAAQTAIKGLLFTPTNNQVTPGASVSTAFTLTVADGFAAPVTNGQTAVVATSVNDAPALGGVTPGLQPVDDDAAVSPFAGVTIADPDVNPITVTVRFDPANGSFSNLGGFAGSAGSYTFTGSPAAAEAAVRGLVFVPTANQSAPNATLTTTFTLAVADGFAATVSDGRTTVAVTSVDDAPLLGGVTGGPQPVNDNAAINPFAGVTVADPDAAPVTVTVTYAAANGSFANLGGFAGSAGSYSFTGSPAAAEAAVRGLVFVPTANQVRPNTAVTTAFTLTVSDGLAPPVADGGTTVTATSVNDVPTLGGVATGPQTTRDDEPIAPFGGLTVADPDVGPVTVTVRFDPANGSLSNLGGFAGAAGLYTFTGSPAAAQAAVRGLFFVPTANQVVPTATVTTAFTVTVDDRFAAAVTDGQTTVVVTSVNDAPALAGTAGPQPVADDARLSPFATATVSDADDATVTLVLTYAAADGTLANLGGFTGSGGRYTFTGTTADAQTALRGLVFTPTNNQVTEGKSVTTVFTLTATDASGGTSTDDRSTVVATNRVAPEQNATRQFAVATPESGMVNVFDGSGAAAYSVMAFAGQVLPNGVRPAVADVTGDGVSDLIAATGTGVASRLQIFDGVTHQPVKTLDVFESSFTGGLFVAAGDVDGDGYTDLAVSADTSGGSRVVVFSGRTFRKLADFFGIDDPNFRGGARVAMGDVNGDGLSDLIVAAGIGGGPRIAVFDGGSVRTGQVPTRLVNDFFAFEPSLRNGAYVSAGDVNGDGKADLVFGGGPGGGPRVIVIDAAALLADGATLNPLADFFASDPDQRQGVRPVVKNYDADGLADLVVLAPTATGEVVNVYRGTNLAAGETILTYKEFDPDFLFGIYVG